MYRKTRRFLLVELLLYQVGVPLGVHVEISSRETFAKEGTSKGPVKAAPHFKCLKIDGMEQSQNWAFDYLSLSSDQK